MINRKSIRRNRLIGIMLITLISVLPLSACTSQNSGKNASTVSTNSNTFSAKSKSASTASSSAAKTSSGAASTTSAETNADSGGSANAAGAISGSDISVQYDSDDEYSGSNNTQATYIVLKGGSITLDGAGAAVEGSKATITSAGTYSISGTLNDGQIIVDTKDEETVRLILNGADITCSTSSPIYVKSAEKVVVALAEGSQNHIKDGASYVVENAEENEPDAALFSKSDLTVNGSGSLTVDAIYNDAIASKDGLKITGGNITVNSAADGIRGKDYVAVKNGNITINAKGDGIKATNAEDTQKGFVTVSGCTVNITSGEDGIQAETSTLISDGNITITSGGGSANGVKSTAQKNDMMRPNSGSITVATDNSSDTASLKGIKAAADITIENGTININSADDAIHSNNSLKLSGGSISITSGDDGIHSDTSMEINGGDINIIKSYEGIESSIITINGGSIHLVASDDGLNIAGGNDASSISGRPGQNNFTSSGDSHISINGGYIYVDSVGDGIDVNGSFTMTEGKVIVNGPTASNNGALDYDGAFKVTGGFIVAAGSSGMAQAPDTSSTQNSVMINLPSAMSAGNLVHVENDKGEDILTFVPIRSYQTVVLCSPELKDGSTYNIYYGGSSSGTAKDGLYSGGSYSAGTKYSSFTVSSSVTTVGTSNNRGGMKGGRQ